MSVPTPNSMPNHPQTPISNEEMIEKTVDALLGVFPKPAVKTPFVRKPHLTDRPLKNNTWLIELRSTLVNTTK